MELMSWDYRIIKIKSDWYENLSDMKNLLRYVWRMSDKLPYGGSCIYPLEHDVVLEALLCTQNYYDKTEGRRMMHVIISYPQNENFYRVWSEAEIVSRMLGKYVQNIWGIHADTDNIHIHFALNAVCYRTGTKLTIEQLRWIFESEIMCGAKVPFVVL